MDKNGQGDLLVVIVEQVLTPDARRRLTMAYELVLRAAERGEDQPSVETPSEWEASDDE